MNDHSAGYTELPRTAYLDHTLRRARTAAEQRSHRYVTLEHLLLALLDDPDALKLLRTVGADVAVIQTAVAGAVNNRMSTLVDPTGRPPSFSYKFDSLFPGASEDALRAARREICGALALIAIAKDPDSYASAILAANGFNPQAALNALASASSSPNQPLQPATVPSAALPASSHAEMAPRPKQEPLARPPQTAAAAYPAPVAQSTREDTGENLMEDMLASVRNILDAEERKERGLPLVSSPSPMPPPAPRGSPPRLEPQLRADAAPDRLRSPAELRNPPPHGGQERIDPAFRPEAQPRAAALPPERRPQDVDHAAGFSKPPSVAFDHEPPQAPASPKKKRKAAAPKGPGRGRTEPPSLLAKVLEGIPRKTSVARTETIQIQLTREDAGLLFARLPRRGQPQQGAGPQPPCRAVTVRLSAPEGGFFIEALTPETQWLFERPSVLGEEPFGTWKWSAISNESGTRVLSVSIFARDIDGNGLLGDIQVPAQAIDVRVRGGFGRRVWGFLGTVLLLLSGSALAVGALYALKITGKLPHWLLVH
ncbi:MAG: Clp protease N-terminal domain-containing protein [Rhodomicrobium sp.]